jgi:molybdopterin synthase catalytic subunit
MSFAIHKGAVACERLRRDLEDKACGAVVSFEGCVRDQNEGRRVLRLEYEIYRPLALKEGRRIVEEARSRWPLRQLVCAHSEGLLDLGQVAVFVGAAAPHRDAAFAAARYVIDEAKRRLPIWKLEHYADGERRWVGCHRCGQTSSSLARRNTIEDQAAEGHGTAGSAAEGQPS